MNLLFIFTDQQHRYALSCMDNPNVETPHLDALASRGILFRRCYSNDPICGPFRGTLMTAQYASNCGVVYNGAPLPEGVTTFADAFNAGGYTTSWVGKWHLGATGNDPIPRELQGGFHRFLGYQCYNGFYKDVVFNDREGNAHRYEKHRTDVTTDLAIEQLEQLAKEENPFMLMMAYQAPHYPEQPSSEFAQMYAGREIIRRPNCVDIDPYTPTCSPPSPKPCEQDPDFQKYGNNLDEYIRQYNAMCTQIDANIGRLIETLDDLGIAEETMIVFTSDHGDMQGSHGLKNKCLPHEESAGIPLIMYVPGMPGGRVSDALVSGIDLMPTCLELAGLPAVTSADGQSIAPLVRGESENGCDAIFSEWSDKWCMIVKDGWKLAAERTEKAIVPMLMTHIEQDPYEMNNLVDDEAVKELRESFFKELEAWDKGIRGIS